MSRYNFLSWCIVSVAVRSLTFWGCWTHGNEHSLLIITSEMFLISMQERCYDRINALVQKRYMSPQLFFRELLLMIRL